MSMREGTRRKKISVLHMLGTWEGKIDGCNCPSCKEYEEEQVAAILNRTPSKVIAKTVKGPKQSPKKTVIKVKTTKVVVDKGTGELIGRKLSPKKIHTLKSMEENVSEHEKSLHPSEKNGVKNSDSKDEKIGLEFHKNNNSVNARTSEQGNLSFKDLQSYSKVSMGKDVVVDSENTSFHYEEQHRKEQGEHNFCEDQSPTKGKPQDVTCQKVLVVSPGQKVHNKPKQNDVEVNAVEALYIKQEQIKQEPEDFFSDEEDIEKGESERHFSDRTKTESRLRKRARMVTSEVENIYAKPRMVFTGRGVVKKFEPGTDKTPKSRRGRKPTKNVSLIKVKQEPKDSEENEESELDQLQKALSEAADSLDVGDYLLDALNEFEEEEPKEIKVRKKAKFRMLKRVDSDGDKYVECNMCFKMLKESSMKQHYKTHTGEKPHMCDECDARFTRKGDVERHKRLVHKNQKPFKCRKCKRNFSDRKNLKLHLQNHDKAIYYACNTCGFKFGKREYYENHIRYIHPLPDGSMPVFCDMDQDLAIEQLQEIESEEKKEKQEKEGKSRSDGGLPVKSEVENLDNEEDEDDDDDDDDDDTATEITVTEGQEENPIKSKKEATVEGSHKIPESDNQVLGNMKLPETNDLTETSCVTSKPQVGTDVRVSKGTLSFTQTVSDMDTQDEDLVNKVIADAVSQATNTIESLQTIAGANLSGNDIDIEDEDEDELMEDEEEEDDDFQEILDSGYDIIPIAQEPKPVEPPSEIHINASVGGQKKKFIIQIPPGSNLNVQTPDGMEMIVSMVNQLCAGKGELDGPIEVVMHNPNTRTLSLD